MIATLNYSLVTAQAAVYGVTTMQVPFGRMAVRAGVNIVRIAGLQTGADYARYGLIFSKPYMARLALQIIGIGLCAVGMLLTMIWAAWRAGLLKPGQA